MGTRDLELLIDVALGRRPADLVIKNAKIFNSFTGKFDSGDVALAGGRVAAVGEYQGLEEFDAQGRYLTPGLFDGHVHIESGMASPQEFTRALAALGTTSIVADPHEIANVAGLDGLNYLLEATEDAPVNVFVMLPSCVPATPLEWGGAKLTADDLAPFLGRPRVLGLAEMMNFPGVLAKDPEVLAKLRLPHGGQVDGHAPGLAGPELSAYASVGIRNDHECSTVQEAEDRLSRGLAVMLRQGSAARNLLNLLPAVNAFTAPFCFLATDDRHTEDLLNQGSINYLLRLAVGEGKLDPIQALRLATLHGPVHYGLKDLGAIAPGFRADLVLFPDLENFRPSRVWKDGRLAAENGRCLWPAPRPVDEEKVRTGLKLGPVTPETFRVPAAGSHLRVIGLNPGELVTDNLVLTPAPVGGCFVADPAADLAKMAVFERHRGSGHVALGFLKGLGLKRGAVATTIAHDSHNLVAAGMDDADMVLVVEEIRRLGGGLAVVADGRVLGSLALPLGGILSDRPLAEIGARLAELQGAVRGLGLAEGFDPFMTLAFMALPVIPSLKLTEAGLVDVNRFEVVPLVF